MVDYNYSLDVWAVKHSGTYWSGFFPFRSNTWDDKGEAKLVRVVPVQQEEAQASDYWAWWSNDKQKIQFVWASKTQVEMCFPYGTAIETKAGRGEIVRVRFTIIQEQDRNHGLL